MDAKTAPFQVDHRIRYSCKRPSYGWSVNATYEEAAMGYTETIDWSVANLLVEASILAYAAYDDKQPTICTPVTLPEYDFVECFTGVDTVLDVNQAEVFGVVFRSPPPGPYTYIFSFRGTASFFDAIEDISFYQTKCPFVPFGADSAPEATAGVASGFWSVYTAGDGTTTPMQTQLFGLLDRYQASEYPISRLLITGHSLGAALSQLFTLDLAFSRYSSIPALNYNYACPQVGNSNFAALFEAQAPQHDPATQAIRIQNTYDLVPCLPPNLWYGYVQAADAFLIAFYGKDVEWWDPYAKWYDHQALNYQAVLGCAAGSPGGVCSNADLAVPGDNEHLVSEAPDSSSVCTLSVAALPAPGTFTPRSSHPGP
jgi:hypothetical protein